MKTFAFNRERTLHVVFALTQIAEATRSTRNLRKNTKEQTKQTSLKSTVSWCWLEACLIDVSSRIQYNTALQSFLSSAEDGKSSPYFRLNQLLFPESTSLENLVDVSIARPDFGTFTATSWGTLDVTLVSPKQDDSSITNPVEREKQEEGDVDGGDWMIPILHLGDEATQSKPMRLGLPGFYGDIVDS
jgi:hypothetical protein